MKPFLYFIFLCLSITGYAQFNVNVLNLKTNHLVYDSNTNKIYASIPSANGANGNSIGMINPISHTLENTVFIGSEPTVLAISDNGQYIYSGFSGASTIRRFDVASQTAGLLFPLGSDSFFGAYYAEDIEVMPGNPNTIAVSRKNINISPRHAGVAIYDDNVMRTATTQRHTGSNRIEFKDNTSLFGYNNETTEYGLRKVAVNAGGLTEATVYQSLISGFYVDIVYHNNAVYSTNGQVVDVSSTPFVIGQFSDVSGPLVYDSALNLVCFASYDWQGNIVFKRFNPNTFILQDSLPISQASGNVLTITTCGAGCYAFNTSDNKVVIIKDTNLSVDENIANNKVEIYPNPTTDYVYIDAQIIIASVEVYDTNGRAVSVEKTDNKLNFTPLSSGLYMIRITDANHLVKTTKVVKN